MQLVMPPEELAFQEEAVRVTLRLSKKSVDFFKSEAAKHNTQYQRMICRLIDSYVDSYADSPGARPGSKARKRVHNQVPFLREVAPLRGQ